MSKKLIAVASAAALALTALVGIAPASAAAFDTDVLTQSGALSGDTAALALTNAALEDNELVAEDLVEIEVDGNTAGTSFTVSATGGVKLVESATDEDGENLPLTAGKTSLSSTKYGAKDDSSPKTFFAYTTSTTAGKVTITSSTGASKVYYVASEVGEAYNIDVTFPTSIPVGEVGSGSSTVGAKVYVKVTDVFGNNIDDMNDIGEDDGLDGDLELKALGAEVESSTWTYDVKRKAFKNVDGIISLRSGNVAMSVELTTEPDLTDAGFGDAKTMAFSTVSVKSLTDQVAALTAQLANTVSKAKYNNLVNKYNKITRGKKAKLVK